MANDAIIYVDYDAPLTEAGDYSDKYDAFVQTIQLYNPLNGTGKRGNYRNITQVIKTFITVTNPARPAERTKQAYGSIAVGFSMPFQDLVDQFPVKKGRLNNKSAIF